MSTLPAGAFDEVSHKWRRLVERRQQHLVELFHSGRWKFYYTEEKFLHLMREAVKLTERWTMIAPPATDRPSIASDADAPEGGRTSAA
jgi:uncharacterized repeat protein (TIGR03809 family)